MLQIVGWVGGWVGKIVIPMSEALRAADNKQSIIREPNYFYRALIEFFQD
jgi:hypothetical protein